MNALRFGWLSLGSLSDHSRIYGMLSLGLAVTLAHGSSTGRVAEHSQLEGVI